MVSAMGSSGKQHGASQVRVSAHFRLRRHRRRAGSDSGARPRGRTHPPSNLIFFAQEKAKPFRGHVTARHPACRLFRKVKVFRASNHRLVAETRTNKRGQWFIPGHNPNGSFFAKVTQERTENRGGTITYLCERDSSPVRHFG